MGLWVMALLISSSIICTTNMSPKICGIPAIGAIGYLFAFAIVMYVLIKHILPNEFGIYSQFYGQICRQMIRESVFVPKMNKITVGIR